MESEGPYSYSSVAGKIVEDAKDGPMAQAMITKALKDAHAEGRKAAEKEFKELLGLANMLESLLVSRAFGGRFTGDDVSNGDREKFWLRSRIGLFSEWKHERGLR